MKIAKVVIVFLFIVAAGNVQAWKQTTQSQDVMYNYGYETDAAMPKIPALKNELMAIGSDNLNFQRRVGKSNFQFDQPSRAKKGDLTNFPKNKKLGNTAKLSLNDLMCPRGGEYSSVIVTNDEKDGSRTFECAKAKKIIKQVSRTFPTRDKLVKFDRHMPADRQNKVYS